MKFKLIVMGFVALLLGLVGLWVYCVGPSRISFESFSRIQEGITQAEVEAILGGAPRWEVEAKKPKDEIGYHLDRGHWGGTAEWWGRAGVITVFYDNKGIVWKKTFEKLPFEPKPRSLWDWFR